MTLEGVTDVLSWTVIFLASITAILMTALLFLDRKERGVRIVWVVVSISLVVINVTKVLS